MSCSAALKPNGLFCTKCGTKVVPFTLCSLLVSHPLFSQTALGLQQSGKALVKTPAKGSDSPVVSPKTVPDPRKAEEDKRAAEEAAAAAAAAKRKAEEEKRVAEEAARLKAAEEKKRKEAEDQRINDRRLAMEAEEAKRKVLLFHEVVCFYNVAVQAREAEQQSRPRKPTGDAPPPSLSLKLSPRSAGQSSKLSRVCGFPCSCLMLVVARSSPVGRRGSQFWRRQRRMPLGR